MEVVPERSTDRFTAIKLLDFFASVPPNTIEDHIYLGLINENVRNLSDTSKQFIQNHINISQFKDKKKSQNIPHIDIIKEPSKWNSMICSRYYAYYAIPYQGTLQNDTDYLNLHRKKKKCLLKFALEDFNEKDAGTFSYYQRRWFSGKDKRASTGKLWIAPNDRTFRISHCWAHVIITLQYTYGIAHPDTYNKKIMKMQEFEDMENENYDCIIVEERTKVDISKTDGLKRGLTYYKYKYLPDRKLVIVNTNQIFIGTVPWYFPAENLSEKYYQKSFGTYIKMNLYFENMIKNQKNTKTKFIELDEKEKSSEDVLFIPDNAVANIIEDQNENDQSFNCCLCLPCCYKKKHVLDQNSTTDSFSPIFPSPNQTRKVKEPQSFAVAENITSSCKVSPQHNMLIQRPTNIDQEQKTEWTNYEITILISLGILLTLELFY